MVLAVRLYYREVNTNLATPVKVQRNLVMSAEERLIQVSTYLGWIVWVNYSDAEKYCCWVLRPDGLILTDGESYHTEVDAMAAGQIFVELSLETEFGEADQN